MSIGKSYKENDINFIKYVLFSSSLENQVTIPNKLMINFEDELL